MGQYPVCAFCSENEKEQNLNIKNKKTNIPEKNPPPCIMDLPIIKDNTSHYPPPLSYIGATHTTIREGFGIIKWTNDCFFKGIFHNGVPSGWGIYCSPKNGTYKGEYNNDLPNGFGIYDHITNSNYEGYWENEKQEGYGIEQWHDGSFFSGKFNMGKKTGIGTYIFDNGNIYMGEWEQNKMNGFGIYSYGKGHIYMGQWMNGLRDGYGEIYENKGCNYFYGYFRNDIQNGFFMFYNCKTGKIIIGFNTNGKIDGIVKIFKNKKEGKLLVVQNGQKLKEIEKEEKIREYLESHKEKFFKNEMFRGYFLMTREELEIILKNKCDLEEIRDTYELIGYLGDYK